MCGDDDNRGTHPAVVVLVEHADQVTRSQLKLVVHRGFEFELDTVDVVGTRGGGGGGRLIAGGAPVAGLGGLGGAGVGGGGSGDSRRLLGDDSGVVKGVLTGRGIRLRSGRGAATHGRQEIRDGTQTETRSGGGGRVGGGEGTIILGRVTIEEEAGVLLIH